MNTSTLHSKLARTLRKSSVAMNMRSLSKVVGGAVASIIVGTLSCSAVTISGEIHFACAFTPIDSAENPVSLLNATGIKFQNPVAVLISSGDFSSVTPYVDTATFIDSFQFLPSLNPSPVDPLWTVGGFSFRLENVTVTTHNGIDLDLFGTGYLYGNGFDETYGTWNFQGGSAGGGMFSFKADNAAVPDGGETLLLLGMSLLGVAVFASRRALA